MQLRSYQQAACDATHEWLSSRSDNPVIVLPTGSGKTPLIAALCRDYIRAGKGRVLILAHVRELLTQSHDKLSIMAPDLDVGLYSAGLGSRELDRPVTIAGIQSIYKLACQLGPVGLILVDECHLVPHIDDGMYRSFLRDARIINPEVRIVGLTATPYRMKRGTICGPHYLFNGVCYEAQIQPLIADGYLCPLRSKAGKSTPDTSNLKVRGGEFVAAEAEKLMDAPTLVESACDELVLHTKDRHSVLIFATGVGHGKHIVRVLKERHGIDCGFVTGETPKTQRDRLTAAIKDGSLKYLANVGCFTTGFDAPNIDSVVLLRPTRSPGLYYQMCGRGFRPDPSKTDCLILDFGGNIERHGPVDAIKMKARKKRKGVAPTKTCPECQEVVGISTMYCPGCGHEFPPLERTPHETKAATAPILTPPPTRTTHTVTSERYAVHRKGGNFSATPTMRVDYTLDNGSVASEWLCFEHEGFPRIHAVQWWRARTTMSPPRGVVNAVGTAQRRLIRPTATITLEHRHGDRFPRIIATTVHALQAEVHA